jgi:N utilization substance protein A
MKKKVKKVENRGIDSAELILALEELEKEKGIKKDYVLESIETALVTAYKRNFDVNSENVKVTMNPETGETHVYEELDVVEEVEDPATQISLEDAKKIDVKYKAGDVVEKELMPKNFGRIAAQTAKQVIVQRIREASRDVIFNEFTEKKGEIISGIVQKVDKSIVVIDLGKIEGIMPLKEQIPTESYYVNQKLRACVADVEKGPKGSTQIIVSRANNEFLRKLFELEIPEIYEGLIEIKSVSRDPGKRCKVAVYSQNENIDPVGSCVGQKGIRIQNIINELCGEKIDVIEWNEDPSIFIAEALLPAKVMAVDIKEEEKFAQVIVPDDQLSLAIGKSGQNARLAAKLTNWKIDIKSKSQFQEMLEQLQEKEENPEVEENEEVNEVVEEPVAEPVEEEVVQEEKPKAKRTRKTTKKEVE